jgi:hypothetical protein
MSNRTSTLGALVFVGIVLAGGVAAVNEGLTQTTPADGTGSQFDAVEELLAGGFEILPLVLMLLVALAVVAVISGRL